MSTPALDYYHAHLNRHGRRSGYIPGDDEAERARQEKLQAELDAIRWTPDERTAFQAKIELTPERPPWAIGEVGKGWESWFHARLLQHSEVEVCLWSNGQPLDQVRAWMGWSA